MTRRHIGRHRAPNTLAGLHCTACGHQHGRLTRRCLEGCATTCESMRVLNKPPRPVAPLAPARPLDAVELEVEGLFVVLRHLFDGRTVDDAWELGRIEALDIRTAQACAS